MYHRTITSRSGFEVMCSLINTHAPASLESPSFYSTKVRLMNNILAHSLNSRAGYGGDAFVDFDLTSSKYEIQEIICISNYLSVKRIVLFPTLRQVQTTMYCGKLISLCHLNDIKASNINRYKICMVLPTSNYNTSEYCAQLFPCSTSNKDEPSIPFTHTCIEKELWSSP